MCGGGRWGTGWSPCSWGCGNRWLVLDAVAALELVEEALCVCAHACACACVCGGAGGAPAGLRGGKRRRCCHPPRLLPYALGACGRAQGGAAPEPLSIQRVAEDREGLVGARPAGPLLDFILIRVYLHQLVVWRARACVATPQRGNHSRCLRKWRAQQVRACAQVRPRACVLMVCRRECFRVRAGAWHGWPLRRGSPA